ncbi:hypothetical protein LTR36_000964 [Oleoguttula mirabilis]|uniref:Inclusion body clearance protein IML2 n=1 Tax=Oleoguttula mirabilis TaxID=1507867 RepID=A0AAV9JPH0_9PEZI|nr:hypothetical protein LTR36_000964 [Oleoguttula mirabilis]
MKRFGGMFGGKAASSNSRSLTALDEPAACTVLQAQSTNEQGLGRATTFFLRAVLGFEKEIMEQASARLAEAEESAYEHQRRAIRDPSTAHQSAIYPIGAEYALVLAESQLMSAVVAVLNESLTESLRGFYKLRKAFTTLHEISEAEKRYLQAQGKSYASSVASTAASTGSRTPAEGSGVLTPDPLGKDDFDDADDDDFLDAQEAAFGSMAATGYEGQPASSDFEKLKFGAAKAGNSAPPSRRSSMSSMSETAANDADRIDFRTITSDPVDLFIHSGTALCFGLLQLMLSMVPPSFSKVLSILSFRGDRAAGIRMLWSATKFKHDINGAMAGLITLGFHNGAMAFNDILSKTDLPEARLKNLLSEMRQLYPKSKLWVLEEARMLGADRQLESAVQKLEQGPPSPLKQVEALALFEKSLSYMYLHRYEDCAKGFIECVGKNNWSHGLYYYISGACYVELYRMCKGSDPAKAAEYAAMADKYLHEVPAHTGKKRFMARQLPFDIFVNRKIAKWNHRAKTLDCAFVDAVGVSPVEEMTYFWSGFKRMNDDQLRYALKRIAWSEDLSLNPRWEQEAVDEKALQALLKGTCLRFLGQIPEAKATLTTDVLAYDMVQIKACDHADNWPQPVAHYEKAVCFWQEAGGRGGDKATLEKCSAELALVEHWEAFELDTRVGMKVATARLTLKKSGVALP